MAIIRDMKGFIFSLILIVLATSCKQDQAKQIEVNQGIIINNIMVISANSEEVFSFEGYVVIEGDRIAYSGRERPLVKGNFRELDGEGKYIISGLMDSHVHLANTAGFNGPLKNKYPELLDAYFEQLPRSYLYHGFTCLIDVNNYAPEVINEIKRSPVHPQIFTCGKQVQVMNDFEMEMEGTPMAKRYESNFLHDPYNKEVTIPDSIDLYEHTPEKIIDHIKNEEGIAVKVIYEDEASGLIVTWAKPSLGIITDLVKEAKKENLPVLIHGPSLEGHHIGLHSGVEILAHGLWNWTTDFEGEFENLRLTTAHKEVLLGIAQKQLGYQLTARTILGEEDLILDVFLDDNNLEHVYPKEYLDVLKSKEGDWGRNKILGRGSFLKRTNPSFYNAMRANHQEDVEMWESVFKLYRSRLDSVALFLSRHKANFIFGSDTPAMNMATNPPGYNGFLEMKQMHATGISLEQILRAATYNNAKAFHLESLYGGVERDKMANLLILKSNPLRDIDAYNDIETVIIAGEPVLREDLSATNYVDKR